MNSSPSNLRPPFHDQLQFGGMPRNFVTLLGRSACRAVASAGEFAQVTYQKPPAEVLDVLNAPVTPGKITQSDLRPRCVDRAGALSIHQRACPTNAWIGRNAIHKTVAPIVAR